MSAIDEIKDRVDIVELVGESVKLRKSGKNYTGFCPFHSNTRTPAFAVFPESGTWRCFGACNEGGDVFRFLMKREGWDFGEALRYLAERAGVSLPARGESSEEDSKALARLRELLAATVGFYRHHLLETPEGMLVRDYLHGRGLADQTLETFELGYAPASWDATSLFLLDKGYSQQELEAAGMVSQRESGGTYDRFRHRIMIPIRDASGKLVGFGARAVDPSDQPKFLNSPQTQLFDKGRVLYGLDKARKSIRASGRAVIVEGYMDVIALHQAGHCEAVSPMGTALTEHQLRLLKRFSRHMVLALDADAAGDRATLRGLTLAREALDRQPDPVFDARGLVRHEGRLDAEIRVVTLPPGQDPDEVVAKGPASWTALLEGARPVVDYVLEVLSANRDLEDPKVKAEIARSVVPLIEDVANPVEREAYRQHLARRLKVDERALTAWRPEPAFKRRAKPAGEEARAATSRAEPSVSVAEAKIERFCLGVLLRDPEYLYRVDRQLLELGLERLSVKDFVRTDHQILFQLVRDALAQDDVAPNAYWRSALSAELAAEAERIEAALHDLTALANMDTQQPKVADEIAARFLALRLRFLDAQTNHLQFELQAAQEDEAAGEARSSPGLTDLMRELQRLVNLRSRLEQGLARKQGPSQDLAMALKR